MKDDIQDYHINDLLKLKIINQEDINKISLNFLIKKIPNKIFQKSELKFQINYSGLLWKAGYFNNYLELLVYTSDKLSDTIVGLLISLKQQNII